LTTPHVGDTVAAARAEPASTPLALMCSNPKSIGLLTTVRDAVSCSSVSRHQADAETVLARASAGMARATGGSFQADDEFGGSSRDTARRRT
jgi:hypothetical protein